MITMPFDADSLEKKYPQYRMSMKPRPFQEFKEFLKTLKNFNKVERDKLTSYEIQFEILNSPDELRAQAGLYRLTMPDGMKYIGQSCDISDRINNHILNFMMYGSGNGKWYRAAKKQFPVIDNMYEYYLSIFNAMTVEVQYLKGEQDSILLEKYALEGVYLNNKKDEYYNTDYYVRDEKGQFQKKRYTNPKIK